nr:HAD family phosphatase [Lysobacter sp. CAU 1642]
MILDFDGVVLDSEPRLNALLCGLLAEQGISLSVEQALRRFTGVASAECLAGIERDFGVRLPGDLGERYHEASLALYASGALPLLPGLVELLDALRRPVAIASGSQRRKIEAGLRAHGLEARFAGRIVSAHEAPRGKPHPDVYLEAARRCSTRPADCIAVEDSPTGARAAAAAGIRVFGLIGIWDAASLAAAGAEPIQRLTDLLRRPELAPWWSPLQAVTPAP